MQFSGNDNIPLLVKASSTTLTLAATNNNQPTAITVGGQQYLVPSQLTLNTATVGANGLDAGALGASQTWYVYAVVNQSTYVIALVASLNAPSTGPTHPSGYGTAEKWIGGFTTDGSSNIASVLQGNQVSSPISTANITGPISAANITGRTDGAAPATGMIGEVLSAPITAQNATIISAASVASLTLSAGVWLLSASVTGYTVPNSGTGIVSTAVFYNDGVTSFQIVSTINQMTIGGSANDSIFFTASPVAHYVSPVGGRTVQLYIQGVTVSGAPAATISSRAAGTFYATRIA